MQRASQQRPVSLNSKSDRRSEVCSSTAVRLFDETTATRAAEQRKYLEVSIEERIRSRLLGRVRNLKVEVHDDVVTLQGQCATYYTKQLAQHAAMGVLEDEQLENAIVVCVGQ